jgi:hypothetical protein
LRRRIHIAAQSVVPIAAIKAKLAPGSRNAGIAAAGLIARIA